VLRNPPLRQAANRYSFGPIDAKEELNYFYEEEPTIPAFSGRRLILKS